MSRPSASTRVVPLALALLALLAPASARAWGGATHQYIAAHYSQHLPAMIDGLRAYDATVTTHVTDPDTRKSSTPGESYKHYIDIDVYPAFLAGTLTHDRATLEAQYGASTVLANGVVPWAVGDVVTTLAQQFQAQQWSAAALTIADLCHYVGDLCQPLHCTQDYDGQMSGHSGIHSRYETTMMASHLAELTTPVLPVAYCPGVVDSMFAEIGTSWADVAPLLQADGAAKTASGGAYNTTYYAALWTGTQGFTRERVNEATRVTAALVYTAWRFAGQPAVPGSSVSVPPATAPLARLEAGPTPFRDHLAIRWACAGPVRVEVDDVRGARVASLVDGATGAGGVTWRGEAGRGPAAPGLYFVRLEAPGVQLVRRVTLVR